MFSPYPQRSRFYLGSRSCPALLVCLAMAAQALAQAAPGGKPPASESNPFPTEQPVFDATKVLTENALKEFSVDTKPLAETSDVRKAFEAGDVQRCLELLLAEYAKNPQLPPPKVSLAGFCIAAGRGGDARVLLEESAKEEPHHPHVHATFGLLALSEGRFSDADLQFEKALAVELPSHWSPDFAKKLKVMCYNGRLTVAERRQHWNDAQELLSKLVDLEPQSAALRDRWASTLFLAGLKGKAFEQFDVAHRQDAAISPPEISMGVQHVQSGNFTEANRWYEAALRKYPNNAVVHYETSVAFLYQDRALQAEQQAELAAKIGITDRQFALHRAQIALQLKQYERAQELLSNALAQDSKDAAARDLLALALVESPQKELWPKGLEYAESNVRQYPNVPQFLATLGWAQFRLDRSDEAKRYAQQTLGLNPDPRAIYFAARIFQKVGTAKETESLARQLEQALEKPSIFPLRPDARAWLQSFHAARPATDPNPAPSPSVKPEPKTPSTAK